jgi:CRP/FNR family cyclic AMP-dependent transcriptional regulator
MAAPDTPSTRLLPQALLTEIAARGGVKRYPARTVIIHEGDSADLLFILLSGRVKVYAANEAGREVILNHHGPGEFVGELSLDGGARSASVVTTEPTTCAVVTGATLRQFIADHPDFGQHLIHHLIGRVRALTVNVKRLALEDVYVRVAGLLMSLSVEQPGGQRLLTERLTQQDIAGHVGSSREMVSRIFKSLAEGGYLRNERGQITLLKKLPPGW